MCGVAFLASGCALAILGFGCFDLYFWWGGCMRRLSGITSWVFGAVLDVAVFGDFGFPWVLACV